jgi:hypothetical protein
MEVEMSAAKLAGMVVLAVATVLSANEAQWTLTGPLLVRQGDPVAWQASVVVTGSNQGLAGYAFNIVVGPSPGPSAGPDGQWGTADDENVASVQLSTAAWVTSFHVQGTSSAGPGSIKDAGSAGGPGMSVLPAAGNNLLKKGELLQVGTGYLTWTPYSPPGQDGQMWGVGMDSRKSALLANPSGGYVLHSGTIPTADLAPGVYTAMLVPLKTRLLRSDLDLAQAQSGFLMMTGSGVGSSFSFTVGTGPAADFDKDGDVDLADFLHFQACFNGPNRPAQQPNCGDADFNADQDVDLADFLVFQACFNGPNRPPNCQ